MAVLQPVLNVSTAMKADHESETLDGPYKEINLLSTLLYRDFFGLIRKNLTSCGYGEYYKRCRAKGRMLFSIYQAFRRLLVSLVSFNYLQSSTMVALAVPPPSQIAMRPRLKTS
jgi:hypothetical protein